MICSKCYKEIFIEKKLPPIQKKTLDFIENFIKENKKSPTVIEIQKFMKFSSIYSVQQATNALEKKGFIEREKWQQRSIKIKGQRVTSTNRTVS